MIPSTGSFIFQIRSKNFTALHNFRKFSPSHTQSILPYLSSAEHWFNHLIWTILWQKGCNHMRQLLWSSLSKLLCCEVSPSWSWTATRRGYCNWNGLEQLLHQSRINLLFSQYYSASVVGLHCTLLLKLVQWWVKFPSVSQHHFLSNTLTVLSRVFSTAAGQTSFTRVNHSYTSMKQKRYFQTGQVPENKSS